MCVRLVPLGGLGEIGMNALVLEDGDDAILIDCGLTFPDEEVGVDVIHADFGYALSLGKRLKAVVLTHGHEDHIGAIPFLPADVRVPVYGPPLALELTRSRLAEYPLGYAPDLRPTAPRSPFHVGSLEIEPISVTHSIPDSTALAIRTSIGTVIHTGDFKVDLDPPDGRRFDLQRLSEHGASGVALLLSDSTNVEQEGMTGGEKQVAAEIRRAVAEAEGGRIFITLFSSNVVRLQAILDCARQDGRRVAFAGRSIQRHVDAAVRLGTLDFRSDLVLPLDQAPSHPRDRLLVVISGTQGEPRSSLTRLSSGEHRLLSVEDGDTVILSSRHIPGNELAISRVIDNLARLGARVVHAGNRPGIHASGHAHREEQKLMIQLVRPRMFVPVHGTYQDLALHARLARELGVEQTLLVENGQVAEVTRTGLCRGGTVPCGRVHRDGAHDVDDDVLRERRALADSGLAVAFVVLDRKHRLAADPNVTCRGVLGDDNAAGFLSGASGRLRETVESAPEGVRSQHALLRERCRRELRRYFQDAVGRKPLALVGLTVLGEDILFPEDDDEGPGARLPRL
ncbi:MAG: ribonuclease J [Myxococcota bacterium]|nr:ribonuclease J [Myxococcota bacterium]